MFTRIRSRLRDVAAAAPAAVEPQPSDDPIRSFAEWATARAEGVCWIRSDEALTDVFDALAVDLPELTRSNVRFSGAGVLHDSGVEWFAFDGPEHAVLVFVMGRAEQLAARQMGVLAALSRHNALVIAGGAVPKRLRADLQGTRGVPVWDVVGAGRAASEALAA